MLKGSADSLKSTLNSENEKYIKGLMDLIYASGTVLIEDVDGYKKLDLSGVDGLRLMVQPATYIEAEGGMTALRGDVLSAVTAQKIGYVACMTRIRESYDVGSPADSVKDAGKGLAYGRRYIQQYARSLFSDFLYLDPDSFTNNDAYSISEQTGMNYIKTISMSGGEGSENRSWLSWGHFQAQEEAFEIAKSMAKTITQKVGSQEKTFGDEILDYDTADIVEYTEFNEGLVEAIGKLRSSHSKMDVISAEDMRHEFIGIDFGAKSWDVRAYAKEKKLEAINLLNISQEAFDRSFEIAMTPAIRQGNFTDMVDILTEVIIGMSASILAQGIAATSASGRFLGGLIRDVCVCALTRSSSYRCRSCNLEDDQLLR